MYVTKDEYDKQINDMVQKIGLVERKLFVFETMLGNLQKEEHLYQDYRLSTYRKAWSGLDFEEVRDLIRECVENDYVPDFKSIVNKVVKDSKSEALTKLRVKDLWIKYISDNFIYKSNSRKIGK